jgi:hypothetical protein
MIILKPLGISNNCNTTSNSSYSNATLVRVSHFGLANDTPHTVQCYYSNDTLRYTTVVLGGESIILEKSPTDYLNSTDATNSMRIVPVAYKN